jgi:hypothetical protein
MSDCLIGGRSYSKYRAMPMQSGQLALPMSTMMSLPDANALAIASALVVAVSKSWPKLRRGEKIEVTIKPDMEIQRPVFIFILLDLELINYTSVPFLSNPIFLLALGISF